MYLPSTPHPQHPHHLECPRCNCHTVVLQGDSRYVCLNCRWEQNLAQEGWEPLTTFLVAVLTIAFLLIVIAAGEQNQRRDSGQWRETVGIGEGDRAIAHLPPFQA